MVRSARSPDLKIVKDQTTKPPETNGPDLESFHYHLGVIVQMKAKVDAVKKYLKTARRAAQDGGIVLKDLDLIIKMREEEPETVQDGIRRIAQYAEWAGLAPGIQGDLFTHVPAKDELEVADHEGYVDGLEGVTAEGDRYDTASPIGQARLKGWHRGQKVIADRFVAKSEEAAKTE